MRPRPASSSSALLVLSAGAAALALQGCAPGIGAACTVSTDCASNGTRVCDTSEPNGYCTILNCTDDTCPSNSACILFEPSVPGCPYDDYQAPARSSLAFCMATCGSNSDCRQDDGYICANPKGPPWYAVDLDNDQAQNVCIVAPAPTAADAGAAGGFDAAVCMPMPNVTLADAGPEQDGGVPADAGAGPDASPRLDAAGVDAGLDARADAGFDAGDDAGPDAATDAPSGDVAVVGAPADAQGGG